ncbi:MAG: PKD domain-containing protein [Bacteroidia bacterium]|nr:PKD domain-containing protein [Bacteroidia bacterium]MDW8133499.1 PKD domain-containing protein [Bacteroidia bacterium]
MHKYLSLWALCAWLYSQQCGYLYVSPTGTPGAAGTPADPLSLSAAIAQAGAGPVKHIRLAIGDYHLTNPLSLEDNIILEGGFDLSNPTSPIKRNNGISRLRRLSGSPELNPCRLVAVQAINKSGFELHDLYIEVENASYTADGPGCSTYGLYLNGCSNYQIVRCRIHAGNATDGKPGDPVQNGRDGAPGARGEDGCRQCQPGVDDPNNDGGAGGSSWSGGTQAGGNGGNGAPMGLGRGPAGCLDLDFCNGASAPSGSIGQNGNTSIGGQPVGLGGNGGQGQNICANFGDAAGFIGALGGCPSDDPLRGGQNGTDGANGRDGNDGQPGIPSFSGGWFIPGDGQNGQPGEHGSGGGGGGGGGALGGIPYDILCIRIDDGYTNSSGGGGGGGGEGGEGGHGGQGGGGGGGAFAVFLWNNGTNGVIRDCPLSVGQAGEGAPGSAGGLGGQGGLGGCGGGWIGPPCQRFCGSPPLPSNNCGAGCQGGWGGNGGKGGNGGRGGRGGDGADGIAQPFYQNLTGQPATLVNSYVPTEPPIRVEGLVCSYSEVTFSVENPDPLTQYEWGFGSNAQPIFGYGPNATTFFTTTGFHTILLRVNSIPYRYTLFASPMRQGVIPDIQLVTLGPICVNSTALLQANLTNPENWPILEYHWRLTGPISANLSAPGASSYTTPALTQPGTYMVYLRVRSQCCGWSLWDSLQIQVIPQQTMSAQLIASPPAVCEGEPVTLTVVGGNLGPSPNFVWRKNGAPLLGAPNAPNYTETNPQSGDTYEVIVSSSLPCISNTPTTTNSVTLTVYPKPQLVCSSPLQGYLGAPITFSIDAANANQLTPPFTYEIDLGNNFTLTGQASTLPITESANYGGAGTYNATITLRDANGCAASCPVVVNIAASPPPTADFNANTQEGCDQLTVTFTATPPADEYRWDFGDGTPILNTTQNPIQHTYTQVGFYTVRLSARYGATWVPVEKVHYIRIYRTPSPQIAVLSAACENQPVQFADIGTDGYSWQWDFGDGTTSTAPGPQHVYATSGTYTVTLTAWSHNRVCSTTVQQQVTINRRPNAQIDLPITRGCVPFTINPQNTSDPAGAVNVIYIWVWGDGIRDTLPNQNAPTHTYSQPGNYNLELVAVSSDGCRDTARVSIVAHPRPTAAFTPTQVTQTQPNTQVTFNNQSQGATSYFWDFGNGQTSTAQNPGPVDFPQPGTYTVTLVAQNAEGCADTARGSVTIEQGLDIFIPNVFTPNGDGINDTWLIRANLTYEVWVYDRWGNLIFEGNNTRIWDGRKRDGAECPEGAYTYKITARLPNGTTFTRSGTVTLLR